MFWDHCYIVLFSLVPILFEGMPLPIENIFGVMAFCHLPLNYNAVFIPGIQYFCAKS